jgi:hypothetical protein
MTTFVCAHCGIEVHLIVPDALPADRLCVECRVIAEAAPEDRAELARIFRKPERR